MEIFFLSRSEEQEVTDCTFSDMGFLEIVFLKK